MNAFPYQNAALSVEDRVSDLMGRMELAEKIAQLGAVGFPDLLDGERLDADAALAVVPHGIGEITRIGATTSLEPGAERGTVQRGPAPCRGADPARHPGHGPRGITGRLLRPWRHGLPAGPRRWPAAGTPDWCRRLRPRSGGSSWRSGRGTAWRPSWTYPETHAGVAWRRPTARNPVLAGVLGAAYVRGMQTDDLSKGVIATGKHFVAHGLSEGGRNHAPVQVAPRELREVYAEPFAAAIREAGLASVMSSYSCVDGLPGSGSAQLLTRLLRGELGFEGMVVADYFSVSWLMSYHRVAADRGEAAAKAITAGLDMELPALDCFGAPLKAAVAAGKVPMAVVDKAVRRVLTAKVRLGLFESPYVDLCQVKPTFADPANTTLARRAATQGIVMLKNSGILPLGGQPGRVAVIGPAADDRRCLQGDYHYPAHQQFFLQANGASAGDGSSLAGSHSEAGSDLPVGAPDGGQRDDTSDLIVLPSGRGTLKPGDYYTEHVTPLAGLEGCPGTGAQVDYARGCGVHGRGHGGLPAAVAAAARADVAVVVVGGRSGLQEDATVGEARDAAELRLTGVQEELVSAVAATGTPTVLVVMSGRAHVLSEVADKVQALLVAWPLGEQGGNALADVLLGRAEPTGRLPVTLPRAAGRIPLYSSHRSGGSRSVFYGDYTDCPHTPLFSFGHGLGYTSFAYSDLSG